MQNAHEDSSLVHFRHTGLSKRYAASVLRYLIAMGASTEEQAQTLQQAGIPLAAINNPSFVITAAQELAAFAYLTAHDESGLSAPVLGYQIAKASPPPSFGIVGLAAQSSANLFEALTTTTMFPELLWGTTRHAVQLHEGHTILSFHFDTPAPTSIPASQSDLLTKRILASNLFVVRQYLLDLGATSHEPALMTLPMAKPNDWHEVAGNINAEVRFDANDATLVYNVDLRDCPTKTPDPMLAKLYVAQAESLANRLRQDLPVKERAAHLLWTQTPPPNRDEVAKKLGLSVRSLSRSLQAEGATFKDLFLDIQLQRAKILLQDTNMSAAAIAFRLGFKDPASFTRSFKAQTGVVPSAWRDQMS